MGGGNKPVTTTNVTKTDLSPEQTELLGLAMPHLCGSFRASPPAAAELQRGGRISTPCKRRGRSRCSMPRRATVGR